MYPFNLLALRQLTKGCPDSVHFGQRRETDVEGGFSKIRDYVLGTASADYSHTHCRPQLQLLESRCFDHLMRKLQNSVRPLFRFNACMRRSPLADYFEKADTLALQNSMTGGTAGLPQEPVCSLQPVLPAISASPLCLSTPPSLLNAIHMERSPAARRIVPMPPRHEAWPPSRLSCRRPQGP